MTDVPVMLNLAWVPSKHEHVSAYRSAFTILRDFGAVVLHNVINLKLHLSKSGKGEGYLSMVNILNFSQ